MAKSTKWKTGMGTTILGTILILVCFTFVLMVLQLLIGYNSAAKAQIVVDTISDAAAVYGKLPMEVDENAALVMANKVLEENQKIDPKIEYELKSFSVSNDLSRIGYKDHILTIGLSATSQKLVTFGTLPNFTNNVTAKVKLLSEVPENVDLGSAGIEIARALGELSIDSPQYKAIVRSIDYYGWKYSQELRWEKGARDCSSFVLSCFRDYTDVFEDHPYGYTQTIWNDAKNKGVLHEVNESDLDSGAFSYEDLKTGDILMWHGSWADDLGRTPTGLGHTGIYLGVSSEDGLPKILHASSSAGGVVVSNLSGMHSGAGKLLGYIRLT